MEWKRKEVCQNRRGGHVTVAGPNQVEKCVAGWVWIWPRAQNLQLLHKLSRCQVVFFFQCVILLFGGHVVIDMSCWVDVWLLQWTNLYGGGLLGDWWVFRRTPPRAFFFLGILMCVYKYTYWLCGTFYQIVPTLTKLRTPYVYFWGAQKKAGGEEVLLLLVTSHESVWLQ